MLKRVATFLSASIGRRLALGMTATLLAWLAIATALSIRDEQQAIQDILEVKGRTTLNITNRRLSTGFDPANLAAFTEEFEPVLADRDFAYAFLFDDNGVLIALNDPGVVPGPHGPVPPVRELTRRNVVHKVGNYLKILAPFTVNGQRVAGLGLGISLHLMDRQLGRLRFRLLLVTAVLLGSALGFIHWWSRRMVAPLSQLTETAERFTAGDFDARVPVDGVDEVGTLAASFNNLAQSLQQTLTEKDRVLAETRRLYRNLREQLVSRYGTDTIVSASTAMQEVFRVIERIATSNATVLITGDSGTGKELVARALHMQSGRSSGPFVAINCGAIPADLPAELTSGVGVTTGPVALGKAFGAAREDFERYYILECLNRNNGNVSRAAREAGLQRQNFYQKLHKFGIQRKDYAG